MLKITGEARADAEMWLEKFRSEDAYLQVHTSGSTGNPKKIQLQKQYMKASARETLEYLQIPNGSRALLCMAPHHIGGLMMLVRAEVGGLELECRKPGKNPLREGDEFYFSAMVPYQARASFAKLHKIKKLILGGAPLDAKLESELEKLPGEVYHSYGMTETISHVALRKIGEEEFFHALAGTRFSQDHRQCLVIDAPDIGVSNLVTNDVVELHGDTAFRWLGRADHVVNSAGLKLHPESLERKIGDLGVEYILTGEPDPELGERLVLVAEVAEEQAEQLKQKLHSAVAGWERYYKPKAIYRIDKLPKTGNGKIQRNAVQQRLAELPGIY